MNTLGKRVRSLWSQINSEMRVRPVGGQPGPVAFGDQIPRKDQFATAIPDDVAVARSVWSRSDSYSDDGLCQLKKLFVTSSSFMMWATKCTLWK